MVVATELEEKRKENEMKEAFFCVFDSEALLRLKIAKT